MNMLWLSAHKSTSLQDIQTHVHHTELTVALMTSTLNAPGWCRVFGRSRKHCTMSIRPCLSNEIFLATKWNQNRLHIFLALEHSTKFSNTGREPQWWAEHLASFPRSPAPELWRHLFSHEQISFKSVYIKPVRSNHIHYVVYRQRFPGVATLNFAHLGILTSIS